MIPIKNAWWVVGMIIPLFAFHGYAFAENTTLGAGDVMELYVLNHPEYCQTLTVMADGYIIVNGVGSLQASGSTVPAIQAIILRELNKSLNSVVISLNLKEVHSRLIRILGNVKQPGELPLKDGMRVLDVVANAGGFLDAPQDISGKLVRRDGSMMDFKVNDATLQPLGDDNPILCAGDLIIVEAIPEKKIRVHIIGEVITQGAFDMHRDCTLASLLAEAGGPTRSADMAGCTVWRGKERMVAFSEKAADGGWMGDARGLVLEDGDLVVVPKNQNNYAIIGQIVKPGVYPVVASSPVPIMDALAEASGPMASADLSKALLIQKQANQSTVEKINLNNLLTEKVYVGVRNLNPGDILYIPPKGNRRLGWEDILAPLTALNVLGVRLFN